jgi:hypothetical protein
VGKNRQPNQQHNDLAGVAAESTTCDSGENLSRPQWPRNAISRLLMVAAGIIVGQAILYGPSLLGRTILLPIDRLLSSGIYIPRPVGVKETLPHNYVRTDLVLVFEPLRRFSAEERAAGRWAVWTPYQYAGTPMLYGKYSPMWALRCCVQSPVVIAWVQILISLSIGFGGYLFCRQVLQVGFWPAALAAWCLPMTGFFIFWEGYPLAWVAGWLPWLLWAIDKTIRRPGGWGALAVALLTYLTVADRQLDIAGQVLLASGIFAIWRLFDQYGWRWCVPRWFGRPMQATLALAAGWLLGFLLAAPLLLPTLEYAQSGLRMRQRGGGYEERPPVGLEALPQTVLPDMYGSTQKGNFPVFPEAQEYQLESSSATYAGLVATLFVAPLAWCSHRHRSTTIFLPALGLFALSWCLNVPGVVTLLRLPGFNMMSHNRFVFVTSLAIVAMMAIGLDVLWRGPLQRRWWFWLPLLLLTVLLGWCLYRTANLPEPLASRLTAEIMHGKIVEGISTLAEVREAQATFVRSYVVGSVLCALGVAGWLVLCFGVELRRWFMPLLATVLMADLLWFAYDRSAQCDPSLYYPKIPALEEVKKATPGRIIGCGCLPALLNHVCRLGDIRGDDGVDPARLIDLARIAANPKLPEVSYAVTQRMSPKIVAWTPWTFRLSPVLDMLNVRYVVFRGVPPPQVRPDFASPDYFVMTNRSALSRVFVPERVETVEDARTRLAKIAADDFRPRQVAYVEEPVQLPAACQGSAKIVEEIPTRVKISVDIKTPGLVVLADLWDVGWHAYYEGNEVRILRANHALRGVVAPQGRGTLEFRYEPASLTLGLWLCRTALLALAGWTLAVAWNSLRGHAIVSYNQGA